MEIIKKKGPSLGGKSAVNNSLRDRANSSKLTGQSGFYLGAIQCNGIGDTAEKEHACAYVRAST